MCYVSALNNPKYLMASSRSNSEDDEQVNVREGPLHLNPVEGEQQQNQLAEGIPLRDMGFRPVHPNDREVDLLDRDHQPEPDKRRIHPKDRDILPADLDARDRQQRQNAILLGRVPNADGDQQQAPRCANVTPEPQEQPQESSCECWWRNKDAVISFMFKFVLSFMIIILAALIYIIISTE
ncbi:hypothetical protein JTE90_017869 [Oedothorax gibbosus]|uniref:Uncharacterized protein n=1 Tax=Oedothorax gibbosus TaxID=931172 RepID=A0AAV6V1U7_9ARAC|nr:hypothetical protein JTE90_017869 [Oedothorax gibbosus]